MKEENQIEYFYDETETLLHFVFKKGQNNLLIVCLNPKESTEQIKVNLTFSHKTVTPKSRDFSIK